MVYRIYNDETDELAGFPTFETLDDWEEFLDRIADHWYVIDDSEEGTVYEATFDGNNLVYFTAILEA